MNATFNPNQQMLIDMDPKGLAFLIRAPIWCNDLLTNVPNKRWSKSARAWSVPLLRQNVAEIRRIIPMAGVTTTDAAMRLIRDHDNKMADMARGGGFPAWYKFKTEPRKHQARAINKCYGLHATALFMDMQTGKSKTAIDMVSAHRMEGHILGVLVLVKLSLRRNWVKQFELHCPIDYDIYLPNTTDKKGFERWISKSSDFKVMVAGWESLSVGGMAAMCERYLLSLRSSAIIGDETTFIAGHKAARSDVAVSLARMSEYRYALTGTPAEEGPMNLYMQFEFLDPNVIGIGDYYAFRNRYAVMGGYRPTEGRMKGKPTQIVGYQNMDELMELIGPHTFQVLKTEAYDLPPKRYEVREVQLSKMQREIYNKVKREKIIEMGDDEHVLENTLELALRLHQIAGGYTVVPREVQHRKMTGEIVTKKVYDPIRVVAPEDNPKIIELMSIIEETRGKKQGIVWVVYSPEIADIVQVMRAAGIKVGELHGGIDDPKRQPIVDAFERGELDWMVANAATGGMGFTMMAAEVSVFFNNTFKAIDRKQAEDRCYGDGQTKSGIWIDIVAAKTVDILVMKALEAKSDVSAYIRHRIGEITKLLDGDEGA